MTDEPRFYVLEDGWQILVMDRCCCHEVVRTFYQAGKQGWRAPARLKAYAFCGRLNRDEDRVAA